VNPINFRCPVSSGLLVAASLLAGLPTLAIAQTTGQISGNLPPVSVVAPPPTGFNPLTQTPQVNAQYALPPAPNPSVAPRAYDAWRGAVSAEQRRQPTVLTPTDIYNGPAQGIGAGPAQGIGAGPASSGDASAPSSR
jgi:hypothetical protein